MISNPPPPDLLLINSPPNWTEPQPAELCALDTKPHELGNDMKKKIKHVNTVMRKHQEISTITD